MRGKGMRQATILLISSLCLFLTACTPNNEKVASTEGVIVKETELETETEKSKSGFGQNPEAYEGTETEIFGLSCGDSYINLVDCTLEDLIKFIQKSGLGGAKDISILSGTVDPYYSFNDSIGKFIFDFYNPTGEKILTKDCKISRLSYYIEKEADCTIKLLNIPLNEITNDSFSDFAQKYNNINTYEFQFSLSNGQPITFHYGQDLLSAYDFEWTISEVIN